MQISASAIRQSELVVHAELAIRYPELTSRYADYVAIACRRIQHRLRAAARREGVAAGELDDTAQHQLANCVSNYALALLGAQHRMLQLNVRARRAHVTTMPGWAWSQRELDEAFSSLAFFEQWVIDGHPLHPAAKVRLGMSPAEILDTSPEWGNTIALRIAALAPSSAAEFGPTEGGRFPRQRPGPLTRLLLREHPQLLRELADSGAGTDHLALIPLHPWQAEHVLETDYAAELRHGAIRLLQAQIPARPLIAYRTVVPLSTSTTAQPSHLKTSLSVRLTNALRGVSPAAARGGPVVSKLLEQILHQEGHFGGRLHIMSELAAAHFQPSEHEATQPGRLSRDAALSALARANPEIELARDELLLPVAALWARSPITGRPILTELLDRVQQTLIAGGRPGSRNISARWFAQRYAEVCLPPLLTLLTRYGIALEAHGENTVLAIRGGLPVRCIIRDFGGIRISPYRLARSGLTAALNSSSAIMTSDADQLRNKLYFALFVNDLSQLVSCLSRCGGQSQASFWRSFGSVAHETFAKLRADPTLTDDAAADATALLEQPWPNKALLTMWLRGDVTNYTYTPIRNPLART